MPRSKISAPDTQPPSSDEVDAIERSVRTQRAVSRAQLLKTLRTPVRRAFAEDVLEKRGLERTEKFVRVPLREQLYAQIELKGPQQDRALFAALKGGTRDEVKKLQAGLFAKAQLVRVWTPKGFLVTKPAASMLDAKAIEPAMKQLRAMVTQWGKLDDTQRVDRDALVSALTALVKPYVAMTAPPSPDDAQNEELVLGTLDGLMVPSEPLVSVPELVRSLESVVPRGALHTTLLNLARKGSIELRPESGMGLLSEDDRARCPSNTMGAVLRWARRMT